MRFPNADCLDHYVPEVNQINSAAKIVGYKVRIRLLVRPLSVRRELSQLCLATTVEEG